MIIKPKNRILDINEWIKQQNIPMDSKILINEITQKNKNALNIN